MRKLTLGLLILLAGWGIGWFTSHDWSTDSQQPLQPVVTVAANTPGTEGEAASVAASPVAVTDTAILLQRNDFTAVLEHYESLQQQADEAAVTQVRDQILNHARRLIGEHRFDLAGQLLQRFLFVTYRDVEARVLLAEVYQGQQDLLAAIDQLYEARGYAWRPAMLQHITARIRAMVAGLKKTLQGYDDQNALLALYQHLIELEPDHAPWFIGLATTQLALDDKEAARHTLLLVTQDPGVGAQARSMLSDLSVALAGSQDTAGTWDSASDEAGVPLKRSGNHFIVAARPADGRSIQLLIDTGASLTIFKPGVLAQTGIRYQDTGRTGLFNTANGPVRAPVYQLESLAVGDWQVTQLEVGVLDLGGGSGVDGLLGMNFLSRFRFFIDQDDAVLHLTANRGRN
jgi:clan AA aspartic protease (TIGR02281 family)